eukprot:scaffold4707_cov117-Isochrysis_galbana.AAC.1
MVSTQRSGAHSGNSRTAHLRDKEPDVAYHHDRCRDDPEHQEGQQPPDTEQKVDGVALVAGGAGERIGVLPDVGRLGRDHPRHKDRGPRGEHAVRPDDDGDRVVQPHDPRAAGRGEADGALGRVGQQKNAVKDEGAARDAARDHQHVWRRGGGQVGAAPPAGAAVDGSGLVAVERVQRKDAQRGDNYGMRKRHGIRSKGHPLPRQEPLPGIEPRRQRERHQVDGH